jgi:hypothetical protein
MARLGSVRPGQGTKGHYDVRQEVRGRGEVVFAVVWWIPAEGTPIRLFDAVEGRLPELALAVAAYLVEHRLPFRAEAQGDMRRLGVPYPAQPADAESGPE